MYLSKKSTNNIVELLIEIDKILAQAENSNIVFIILPSPFLGYLYYKKYYESFKNFYDKHDKYRVAYLENDKDKMDCLKKN